MTNVTHLIQERGQTHGDYSQVARIAQRLKQVIDAEQVELSDEHRESLDLIFTKIARIASGNADFADHWDDISGYAKLASERCG